MQRDLEKMMTETSPPPMPPRRLDLIDAARGLALVAMIVFHFAWDLSTFGVIATKVSQHLGWRWFAYSIAASFLFLSGVSLVLAHGAGVRWDGFFLRLAMVAGGALLVTAGTWYLFPETYVVFGILHHIAVASILALPFLRLPALITLAAAAGSLALPHVVSSHHFEAPWLIWLGLGRSDMASVDWVPVFPWFGWVLAGVAAARLFRERIAAFGWSASGPFWPKLSLAGRHTLLVYLLHQPALISIVWLIGKLMSPAAGDAMTRFEADCVAACTGQGKAQEECVAACACTRGAVERDPELFAAIKADKLNQLLTLHLTEKARICARDPSARP